MVSAKRKCVNKMPAYLMFKHLAHTVYTAVIQTELFRAVKEGSLTKIGMGISYVLQLWSLTLILLTWSIGWAPNNAKKWQMGLNSAFKGLKIHPDLPISIWVHFIYLLQRIPMDRLLESRYGNVIGQRQIRGQYFSLRASHVLTCTP